MDQPTPSSRGKALFPGSAGRTNRRGPKPDGHSNPGLDISTEPAQSIEFGRKRERILAAMPRED